MKKVSLSVLIASSLFITACDQSAETSEAVTETNNPAIEETVEVTTQLEETVSENTSDTTTEVIEDITNTAEEAEIAVEQEALRIQQELEEEEQAFMSELIEQEGLTDPIDNGSDEI